MKLEGIIEFKGKKYNYEVDFFIPPLLGQL